jgi:hypothetical protein
MAAIVNMICAKNEAEYFCKQDWTGQISLMRHEKLDFRRIATPLKRIPDRQSRAVGPITHFHSFPSTQFPK